MFENEVQNFEKLVEKCDCTEQLRNFIPDRLNNFTGG